jgi:hypothetical protein
MGRDAAVTAAESGLEGHRRDLERQATEINAAAQVGWSYDRARGARFPKPCRFLQHRFLTFVMAFVVVC